jgi:acetolactate synthase-1/2/3 large subunit
LRHILVCNEQGASIMANAVGRATGRPGICLVTTGPAACKSLTAVADAARDSVPINR